MHPSVFILLLLVIAQLKVVVNSFGLQSSSSSKITRSLFYGNRRIESNNILYSNSDSNSNSNSNDEVNRKNSTSIRNENVGLFAAGDRKVVNTVASFTSLSPSSSSSTTTTTTTTVSNPNQPSSSSSSKSGAIELKAELLRLEAELEQIAVDNERIMIEKKRLVDIDKFISKMFTLIENKKQETSSSSSSSPSLLKEDEEKAVVEAVCEQLINASANKEYIRKEMFFRLIELANSAESSEKNRIFFLVDTFMETLSKADTVLYAEITSEVQKDLNKELNRLKSGVSNRDADNIQAYDQVLQQWIKQTMDNANNGSSTMEGGIGRGLGDITNLPTNITSMMDPMGKIMRFPSALPAIMLPLLFRTREEISSDDLQVLKSAIFTNDIINNTKVDSTPFLLTFRGIPTVSLQSTYETALKRISLVPGMDKRVRLFLLPEYRPLPDTSSLSVEKYSGAKYEIIFTIVPKNAVPKAQGWGEYLFASLLVVSTLVTTFIYSTDVNSMNQQFVQSALDGDVSVVEKVGTLALGILGLQLVHDLGHYLFAFLNKTKLSVPYLIPSLQIGLFGSITNFLSYPKSRKELFDISIAGPVFGFAASLACTIYGLGLTVDTAPDVLSAFPALPQGFFSSSLLLYELANSYLDIASKDPTSLIYIHPAVAIGITGLIVNALNFIPIGRLDGGRVTMAIAGRQSANGIALAALIGQAISVLTNSNPVNFFWSLVVVFLQRGADYPPEDDITPVATDDDDKMKGIAWFGRLLSLVFCVSLTASILLPVPIDPMITTTTSIDINSNIIQGL